MRKFLGYSLSDTGAIALNENLFGHSDLSQNCLLFYSKRNVILNRDNLFLSSFWSHLIRFGFFFSVPDLWLCQPTRSNSTTQNQSSRCAFRTAAFHSKFVSIKLYNSEKTTVLKKKKRTRCGSVSKVGTKWGSATRTHGDGARMKSEVRLSYFLATTLPSFVGYIRADETNVEVPQTRKVVANKIPAMSAICVITPFSMRFFFRCSSPRRSLSLSLSFSLVLPHSPCVSLPPSLSPSRIWIWSGLERERRNERNTARRRI